MSVPNQTSAGDYASLKWLPNERYNYRGGRLYPDALPNSFERQPSQFWDYKSEECRLSCSNGFVGCRDPATGIIRQQFIGLPGSDRPIDRSGSKSYTFRRRQFLNRPPPVPNGKQAVARQLLSVPVYSNRGLIARPRYKTIVPHGAVEDADKKSDRFYGKRRAMSAKQRRALRQLKCDNEDRLCAASQCFDQRDCLTLRQLSATQATLEQKGVEQRTRRALCVIAHNAARNESCRI